MATKNDITGDALVTKVPSRSYDEGWERIFGKKSKETKDDSDRGLDQAKDIPQQEAT